VKRDLVKLARGKYQVLVVGGGIYGACVAWDAALRGLSVALIDRGDFGGGTSANSLKIIHGGLRYLQDVHPGRFRKMTVERSTWLRIAPHLVHPLACLTPTYSELTRSKPVLMTALALNDMLSFDRNRSLGPGSRLQKSRIISQWESLKILDDPGLGDITGGAIWHDAQIFNSERLLLAFVLSASQIGADVANYVEALSFTADEKRIKGVRARDVLKGDEFEIQAEMVINCAGVWVDNLLDQSGAVPPSKRYIPSKALNLVISGNKSHYAVGLLGKTRLSNANGKQGTHKQMLFFVPWRGYTLIGTKHFIGQAPVTDTRPSERQIAEFVDEINKVLPSINLGLEEIRHVHWGYLPMVDDSNAQPSVKLVRDSRIHDHQREDDVEGLITVVGVKFTTARTTAQQTVDLIVRKLGVKTEHCRTHETPICGGNIDHFANYLARAQAELGEVLDSGVVEHLVYTYGSEYRRLLVYLDQEPGLGERVV
jgi:glycerol-3-phosphate dehydrogenase